MRLVRSRDSFGLMDPTGCFSVHIDKAKLVLLAHAQSLSKTTAKYLLTVELKAVTMYSRIHGETLDNRILSTAKTNYNGFC